MKQATVAVQITTSTVDRISKNMRLKSNSRTAREKTSGASLLSLGPFFVKGNGRTKIGNEFHRKRLSEDPRFINKNKIFRVDECTAVTDFLNVCVVLDQTSQVLRILKHS